MACRGASGTPRAPGSDKDAPHRMSYPQAHQGYRAFLPVEYGHGAPLSHPVCYSEGLAKVAPPGSSSPGELEFRDRFSTMLG